MLILQVDNVIILDNVGSLNPIYIHDEKIDIQDAIIIKMKYEAESILLNLTWALFKYLLKRTKEFNEAFAEANNK